MALVAGAALTAVALGFGLGWWARAPAPPPPPPLQAPFLVSTEDHDVAEDDSDLMYIVRRGERAPQGVPPPPPPPQDPSIGRAAASNRAAQKNFRGGAAAAPPGFPMQTEMLTELRARLAKPQQPAPAPRAAPRQDNEFARKIMARRMRMREASECEDDSSDAFDADG